jgi:hypothetical protein
MKIAIIDTKSPVFGSIIHRVNNKLIDIFGKSSVFVITPKTYSQFIHLKYDYLILTSYRFFDLKSFFKIESKKVVFVQHGMQSTKTLKRQMISLLPNYLKPTVDYGLLFNSNSNSFFKFRIKHKMLFQDHQVGLIKINKKSQKILLIDQPIYNTKTKYKLFINNLNKQLNSQMFQLYIKYHPRSNYKFEQAIDFNPEISYNSILGFSSSMLFNFDKNTNVYIFDINLIPDHLLDRVEKTPYDFFGFKMFKIKPDYFHNLLSLEDTISNIFSNEIQK